MLMARRAARGRVFVSHSFAGRCLVRVFRAAVGVVLAVVAASCAEFPSGFDGPGLASEIVAPAPSALRRGAGGAIDVAVTVRDNAGGTVSGVMVTFTPDTIGNNGSVTPASVLSDASGVARTSWSIPRTAGTYRLRVRLPGGAVGTVEFVETVGPPARLAIDGSAAVATESGVALGQVTVAVQDSAGQVTAATPAVQARVVVPSTGVALSGITQVTAAAGRATFPGLTLAGAVADSVTLEFTAPGASPALAPTRLRVALRQTLGRVRLRDSTPRAVTAGAAVAPVVVELRDKADTVVRTGADASRPVRVSRSAGTATLSGEPLTVTAVAGVATFGGLRLGGATGAQTLRFAVVGADSATVPVATLPVTVGAGPAATLAFTRVPSALESGVGETVSVELRDSTGLRSTEGGLVTLTLAAGAAPGTTLGGGAPSATVMAVNGLAEFPGLSVQGPSGEVRFAVTRAGLPEVTSAPVPLTQVVRRLRVTQLPIEVASGQLFTPALQATVQDSAGLAIASGPGASLPVTVALASGSGTLTGLATVTAVGGVATFETLRYSGTDAFRLRVTATAPSGAALAATTDELRAAGPPARLAFVTPPPATVESGVGVTVVVQVQDAAGLRTADSAEVTLTLAPGAPVGTTLGGGAPSRTVRAVRGEASFPNVVVQGPPGQVQLLASRAGVPAVPSITSNDVNLTQQPRRLRVTRLPAGIVSGQPFTPTVQATVQDAAGLPITSGSGAVLPVTISLFSGAGTLAGEATATAVAGVATFPGLTFTGTGLVRLRVAATAPGGAALADTTGLLPVQQPPTKLLLVAGAPTTGANGAVLAPFVVQLAAADDAPVQVRGRDVFIGLTGPAGGTLSGTTTLATDSVGRARFADLRITGPVGTYTLEFASPALTSVSGTLTLSAGAPTQVAVTADSARSAPQGAQWADAITVTVRDASNNPVAGRTVTFGVASGGGSVTNATQTTNAAGQATLPVNSWTLGAAAGANSLTATVGGTTPALVATITATGTALQLAVTADSARSAPQGAQWADAITVTVRDASNNPVAGRTVTFAVASGGGTVTNATQTTNTAGEATLPVNSWTLGAAAGPNTLTASVGGTAPALVATITATGTALQVAVTAGNNQSATVGTAVSGAITVTVRDVNNNPVQGRTVTFAVASGDGTVTNATQTTNAGGEATLPASSWTLGAAAGPNTLTATVGGTAPALVETITATGTALDDLATLGGSLLILGVSFHRARGRRRPRLSRHTSPDTDPRDPPSPSP
jgi:hypothetical protein